MQAAVCNSTEENCSLLSLVSKCAISGQQWFADHQTLLLQNPLHCSVLN